LLSGSSILDSSQAPAGAFVKIVFKDATIRILKPGNYRMDADTAQLRVYVGEAEVTRTGNGSPVRIEASQLMPLDGAPVVKRFTQGSDGLLDLWSEERGSLIASNMVNSQSIGDPLLDQGPAVPADLASLIGYMPMTTMPAVGLSGINPYGYSYLYPSYSGFSPYASLVAVAYPPVRPAVRLYVPRYGYSSVTAGRPVFPGGLGIVSPPRPVVFAPRPTTVPRVVMPVHPIGRR
jgi:hypothetical protein